MLWLKDPGRASGLPDIEGPDVCDDIQGGGRVHVVNGSPHDRRVREAEEGDIETIQSGVTGSALFDERDPTGHRIARRHVGWSLGRPSRTNEVVAAPR